MDLDPFRRGLHDYLHPTDPFSTAMFAYLEMDIGSVCCYWAGEGLAQAPPTLSTTEALIASSVIAIGGAVAVHGLRRVWPKRDGKNGTKP